jgi:hypothetical protein
MANVRISDLSSEVDLSKIVGLVGYVETSTSGVFNTVKIKGDPFNSSKDFVVYTNSSEIPTSGLPAANIARTELKTNGITTYYQTMVIEGKSIATFKANSITIDGSFGFGNGASKPSAIELKTNANSGNEGSILISSNGGGSAAAVRLRSKKEIQIDLHSIGSASAPAVGDFLKAKDTEGNIEFGEFEAGELNIKATKNNDFDGSQGNWTIQVGTADDELYAVNNDTGNKFRISLEPYT